jgi:hypothetical protein
MTDALNAVGGAIVGFLAAFAVFERRVTKIEENLNAHKEQVDRDRKHDHQMLEVSLAGIKQDIAAQRERFEEAHAATERRQKVSLDILANVARKLNVAHRAIGADALINAGEDDNGSIT